MKRTIKWLLFANVFLFSTFPILFADPAKEPTITLHRENISLRQALEEITEQTQIYFIYADENIDDRCVNCDFDQKCLQTVLKQLLTPFQLKYYQITSGLYSLSPKNTRSLLGYVYDAESGAPLAGANVYVKENTMGIATQATGAFNLNVPVDTRRLTVSFMGYKTREINLFDFPDSINIQLSPIVIMMQPVTVESSSLTEVNPDQVNSVWQNEQADGPGLITDILRPSVKTLPLVQMHTEIIQDPVTNKYHKKEWSAVEIIRTNQDEQSTQQNRLRLGQFRENLTVVDGIRLLEPYHLRLIPGQEATIFSLEMMKHAQFFNGGFSVDYGDALNSMLDIQYQPAGQEKLRGKAGAGIFGQEIFLSKEHRKKYSILFHARHHDSMIKTNQTKTDRHLRTKNYDVQTKMAWSFSPNNRIEFYFLNSEDQLESEGMEKNYKKWETWRIYDLIIPGLNAIQEIQTDQSNYKTQIASLKSSYRHPDFTIESFLIYQRLQIEDGSRAEHQISTSFEHDSRFISEIKKHQTSLNELEEKYLSGKCAISFSGEKTTEEFGLTYDQIRFSSYQNSNEVTNWRTNLFQERPSGAFSYQNPIRQHFLQENDSTQATLPSFKFGTYYAIRHNLSRRLIVNLGARLDYFHVNESFSINPRISAQFFLTRNILLQSALGLYSQAPDFQQIKTMYNSDLNPKNQKATHFILSAEVQLRENLSLKAQTFYKKLENIIPLNRLSDGSLVIFERANSRQGYSTGIQIESDYQTPFFKIRLTYALLASKEKFSGSGNRYFARYNEQRHTFYSGISRRLPGNIIFSLNNYFGSGYAFTPCILVGIPYQEEWKYDIQNSAHFPAYYRLDFEIKKSFLWYQGSLNLYLKLMNVLNRKNICSYSYGYNQNADPICESQVLYGFFPLAGLSFSF